MGQIVGEEGIRFLLKPFATLTPCRAWGSSPFGVGLAHYDSRLLQLCRSSDIHGTLEATKSRCASGQGGRSGSPRERRDCEIRLVVRKRKALEGIGAHSRLARYFAGQPGSVCCEIDERD